MSRAAKQGHILMAESVRPRNGRIARPLRRQTEKTERLSGDASALVIAALSLLCWVLLVLLGTALWSALG
jgi:hypothetical protein